MGVVRSHFMLLLRGPPERPPPHSLHPLLLHPLTWRMRKAIGAHSATLGLQCHRRPISQQWGCSAVVPPAHPPAALPGFVLSVSPSICPSIPAFGTQRGCAAPQEQKGSSVPSPVLSPSPPLFPPNAGAVCRAVLPRGGVAGLRTAAPRWICLQVYTCNCMWCVCTHAHACTHMHVEPHSPQPLTERRFCPPPPSPMLGDPNPSSPPSPRWQLPPTSPSCSHGEGRSLPCIPGAIRSHTPGPHPGTAGRSLPGGQESPLPHLLLHPWGAPHRRAPHPPPSPAHPLPYALWEWPQPRTGSCFRGVGALWVP